MLLQKLIDKQGRTTDAEFAATLGVSRQMWGFVRTRRCPLHKARKVLCGAMAAYPDLAPDILSFFANDANKVTKQAS